MMQEQADAVLEGLAGIHLCPGCDGDGHSIKRNGVGGYWCGTYSCPVYAYRPSTRTLVFADDNVEEMIKGWQSIPWPSGADKPHVEAVRAMLDA